MAIFMPMNEYGFCVNISDPRIRKKYESFKQRKGLPQHFPISDQERLEFEAEIREKFLEMYPERAEIMFRALNIKRPMNRAGQTSVHGRIGVVGSDNSRQLNYITATPESQVFKRFLSRF